MDYTVIVSLIANAGVLLAAIAKLQRTPSLNAKDRRSGVSSIEESTAELLRAASERSKSLQERVDTLESIVSKQREEIRNLAMQLDKSNLQLAAAQRTIKSLSKELDKYKADNTVLANRIAELLVKCGGCDE